MANQADRPPSGSNWFTLNLDLSEIELYRSVIQGSHAVKEKQHEHSLLSPAATVQRLSRNLSLRSQRDSYNSYVNLGEGPSTFALAPTGEASVHEDVELQSPKLGADPQPEAQPEAEQEVQDYPHGFRLFVIILALVLGVLLVALDLALTCIVGQYTIVATAIPKITVEFDGLQDVSWYGAAFFMTTGGFQNIWGKAFKYFPLKNVFLASMAIFELGSLLCGVAPTSTAFIIGRAVAGVGAAGVGCGVYIIAGHSVAPKRRPAFTGILGSAFGLAMAPGSGKAQETRFAEKMLQMDPLAVVLLMGAIISFILALQYGGQAYPWYSSRVIGLLVACVLLVITFCLWEAWQGERAMMPPRLMRMPEISVTGIVNLFLAGSYLAVVYFLPTYFQAIQSASPIDSSVRNLPLIVSVIIGTIGASVFVTATGIAAPLLLASAGVATIGIGLCYTFDRQTPQRFWIGAQVLAGVPLGIGFQLPVIISQASVLPADLSPATAIQLFFQLIGGALFVTASQSAFVNRLLTLLPSTAPSVPPALVVQTGASALRQTFSVDEIDGVLLAYMGGIKAAIAIAICGSGIAFIAGTHLNMKKLNTETIKLQGGGM
ncbi:hypothetical protein G7054_g2975 [Neopestalotiopsis clavispora]|nr:hypothetical protein G7054_g2975 [Neopestalotiopsis clavispora]